MDASIRFADGRRTLFVVYDAWGRSGHECGLRERRPGGWVLRINRLRGDMAGASVYRLHNE